MSSLRYTNTYKVTFNAINGPTECVIIACDLEDLVEQISKTADNYLYPGDVTKIELVSGLLVVSDE